MNGMERSLIVCTVCGQHHEFGEKGFVRATPACPLTCVYCLKPIAPGEPRELETYPAPSGYMHKACSDKHAKDVFADMETELDAERRMEENLYGYEIPRY